MVESKGTTVDGQFGGIDDERGRRGHWLGGDWRDGGGRRGGRGRLREASAGCRWSGHHQLPRVLLRLHQHQINLWEKQAEQLDQPVERERKRQGDDPDDVAGRGQVERHKRQPEHDRRVIGERDASGLVESHRTLSRLDRVERGRHCVCVCV